MEDVPYSVSELAACVTGSSPQRRELCLRRLRHWGSHGVLATTTALHVGTGRSRRFGTEQVYIAAVLLRLADLGLSIGALKAVAQVIAIEQAKGGDNATLWEEAKRRRIVFMRLSIQFDDAGEKPVSVAIGLVRGSRGLNAPDVYMDDDTVIIMNLTEIFAGVRL